MISENPQYNQNQTQFSIEEPILEKPLVVEPMTETPPVQMSKKKKLTPLAKWAIVAVSLLLIAITLMVLMPKEEVVPIVEESKADISPEFSPLEQRLRAAESLLKQINPTSEKLPFPPVITDLRIDN